MAAPCTCRPASCAITCKRDDGALPTIVAVSTLPLVLADGSVLAEDKFDRLRGIDFRIQPEVAACVPKPGSVTDDAVYEAMTFLDRRVAGRRRHRLRRQVHHHRRRAHHDRALAARPASHVLRHRRTPRWRQDHDSDHADQGHHRHLAGGGGVVDQRGGAAQGAAVVLPLRRGVHSLGQYRARHADQLSAHREVLHRGLLFRPQARRQRDGRDRSLDHSFLHRQQHRAARRPCLTQPRNPARA